MNMKELLAALAKAETVEQINNIKGQIEEVQAREKAIAEKNALLEQLKGQEEDVKSSEQPARTLGEFARKNLDLSAVRSGAAKSAGTNHSFKAQTDPHTAPTITTIDQNVVDTASLRSLDLRNLFGAEQISGNSIQYFVLGTTEGAPAVTAEGAQKPQFHIPYEPETASLQKIAGWYYETDELLDDAAYLESSINNRGLFELDLATEDYLMTTLTGTSGILAPTLTASSDFAEELFKAAMSVKTSSNYNADAIVINPVDYQLLRIAKDENGQYYGGGYFYAPYNGQAVQTVPGLWGLNTVITTATASGTGVVGAFKPGASVITKAGEGARVEVVTGDHDDRTNNRVTVIVEERMVLVVRVPAAFSKVVKA